MPNRTSSRVYNTAALEVWFANVGLDWEAAFTREALRRGREIYRKGQISGVELDDEEAIVHCTFARKDTCYAVVEWSVEGPLVRCSTDDKNLGDAVAIGGLYEVEELIADEIDPLPYVPKPKDEVVEEPSSSVVCDELVEGPPARRLTPKLEGLLEGLRLTAYWTNVDLSQEDVFRRDEKPLSSAEREILLRLTGLAREVGFKFRRESNDFILYDPARIAPFFSHTRKRWGDLFGYLDLDFEAQCMAEGVRDVKVVGRVESAAREQMRVDWRLKLGRQWLDPKDAERLAKAGRGTHIVRGLGLVRIGEDQSAALAEWRVSAVTNSEEAQTWPRFMVFSLFGERGAELDLEEELSSWREHLLEQVEEDDGPMPDFLRPYQKQGVHWMAKLRDLGCHGLLADEMGLGKTLQVLTLLNYKPFKDSHSLIVCPASVVPVWESEARRWYPNIKTEILRSGNDFSGAFDGESKLWVASYTQLRRHKHLLDDTNFGYVVLDEAQQIKNPDAKVTQACCAINAECRLALTGTPIENRLLDLWTLFRFLMPGLLGSRRRFEDALESSRVEFREAFEKRLRQQLAPFILRRQKDKVGKDLPPKVEMDLICPITELQKQTYESLLNRGREELGDDLQSAMQSQSMHFFSLLTRLRQVCCDPGLVPDVEADLSQSGKIQMLLTRLEEALEGDGSCKVVIFSQFVSLLKRLKPVIQKKFPKVAMLELSGETRVRSEPVDNFQT
ncbi:SNF2-related protein, partial [Puniceicoccaceae bacterium]|nr:SNF2-related protein [Puniceicoccaceae bacterium]